MRTRMRHTLAAFVKPPAIFHGFILGYYIGARWNLSPTGCLGNPKMTDVAKEYLTFVYGDDEWAKRQVVEVIRNKSRKAIRDEMRHAFPSLWHKKRQKPLQLPKELEEEEVKFDIEFINRLKEIVTEIKKEYIMESEQAIMSEEAAVNTPKVRSTTVVIPESVNVNELTLDNFRAITGKRFRMTKEQFARSKAGQLTREQAFEELKATLKQEN